MLSKALKPMFVLLAAFLLWSCNNELNMTLPIGPQGPEGKSAYEVWVSAVESGQIDWPQDRTDINSFFLYLKGKDGRDGVDGVNGKSAFELWKEEVAKGIDDPHHPGQQWDKTKTELTDFWYYLTGADGADGVNGSTPMVGSNGNWWIDGKDTGIKAVGSDGTDGRDGVDAVAPSISIGSNGNWFIDGVDTGMPSRGADGDNGADGADGKDGVSPTVTIGTNGNWFINGVDTGTPARGEQGAPGNDGADGADGKTVTVAIGENGNWYIDGIDTGISAFGQNGNDGNDGKPGADGKPGSNGLSAYELWVQELRDNPENVTKNGQPWPPEKNTIADFWEFLRGEQGEQGDKGEDGEVVIEWQTVVLGKPNVIAQPITTSNFTSFEQGAKSEFVDFRTGSVLYQVYDSNGETVGAGVLVKGMPKTNDPEKIYTTDENGQFRLPRLDLPESGSNKTNPYNRVQVSTDGGTTWATSAKNTFVPVRVKAKISSVAYGVLTFEENNYIQCYVQRKLDDDPKWESIPSYVIYPQNVSVISPCRITERQAETTSQYYAEKYLYNFSGIISKHIILPSICDFILPSKYISVNYQDYQETCFTVAIEDCYGETIEYDKEIAIPLEQQSPRLNLESVYYTLEEGAMGQREIFLHGQIVFDDYIFELSNQHNGLGEYYIYFTTHYGGVEMSSDIYYISKGALPIDIKVKIFNELTLEVDHDGVYASPEYLISFEDEYIYIQPTNERIPPYRIPTKEEYDLWYN